MLEKKVIITSIAIVLIAIAGFLSWWFIKGLPDLTLASSDISFSPEQPEDGDSVVFLAKISNSGRKASENILVQFFNDDPEREGKKIGEASIDSINSGQSKEASVEWQATFGIHRIYVLIDSEDQIKESNEENNKAVAGMVVSLPIIESKELSEKEFLEDSLIKELNDIAKEKGYTQIVSANHTDYVQDKESTGGVLFSETDNKVSYLIKFGDQAFLVERDGEDIILTSKDGQVSIKDGELSAEIEEDYQSCSYDHCLYACTLYFIYEDDLWNKLIENSCDACNNLISAGGAAPEAIAALCTTCVSSIAGAVGGCAANCWDKAGGNSCNWCLTDACGPTKNCHTPHCVDRGATSDVYELCTTHRCVSPLTNTSQCLEETRSIFKEYCDDVVLELGEVCKEDKIFWDELIRKISCQDGQCVGENKTTSEFVEDCSATACPYPDQEGRTASCVGEERVQFQESHADCYCCFDNNDCKVDQMYKTEPVCYDEGSMGEKQYFHSYICTSERDKCILESEPRTKTIQKEGCGQDYVDYGDWQCHPSDEKTRERTRTLHDYYCQNAKCHEKVESMLAEKQECQEECSNGECVVIVEAAECTSDVQCSADTMEWRAWECQDDGKTLERETYWWNDYYCSSGGECLLDTTKTETQTQTCLVRCLVNECVEEEEETGCSLSSDCPAPDEEQSTTCEGDNLVTNTIRYNYYCQDGDCLKETGTIVDTQTSLCPKKCSNNECVECLIDTDCTTDYTQWGNWFCYSESTLKKTETRYKDQCIQGACLIGSEPTGNEQTQDCLVNETCQTGACIKKYGFIVGADGLAVRYKSSTDYSIINPPSSFSGNLYDLDFYPGGVLIAGDVGSDGKILRYDGQNTTLIEVPLFPTGNYTGVEFRPGDSNYALIVGDKIVEWELGSFNTIVADGYTGNDVAWKPDGSYALIVEDGQVLKFTPSSKQIFSLAIPEDILWSIPGFEDVNWTDAYLPLIGVSWKPDGTEAYIISDSGIVLIYDGSSFSVDYDPNNLPYAVNFQDIDFKPNGQYALIVEMEMDDKVTIKKYDGANFTSLYSETTDAEAQINYYGVAWISDTQALVVGELWTFAGGAEAKAWVYDDSSGSLTEVIWGLPGTFLGVNW